MSLDKDCGVRAWKMNETLEITQENCATMKLRAFVVLNSVLEDIAQTTFGNEAAQNPRTLHLVTLPLFVFTILEVVLSFLLHFEGYSFGKDTRLVGTVIEQTKQLNFHLMALMAARALREQTNMFGSNNTTEEENILLAVSTEEDDLTVTLENAKIATIIRDSPVH